MEKQRGKGASQYIVDSECCDGVASLSYHVKRLTVNKIESVKLPGIGNSLKETHITPN